MNKKQSKRQRDIKTKLMAAICMLLVSSIMMVSTTYAWFTLSTAPEVTGITTAVGANGNLEMALMPLSGKTADITSAVGDSMSHKTAPEANVTWGNLVDLSDVDYYGLDKITLYPSQLSLNGSGNLGDNPLLTPVYGADGRVVSLAGKTIMGSYTGGKFMETIAVDTDSVSVSKTATGVRAIGTSSSLSDRELAYRSLMSEASGAAALAQRTASSALTANGNTLANVAIDHATKPNAKVSSTDVAAMKAILNALLGDGTSTGSLGYIENAMKQYIIAHNLASAEDATFEDLQAAMQELTLSQLKTATTVTGEKGTYNVTLPTNVADYITKLETAKANVTLARDGGTDASGTTITGLNQLDSSKTEYEWNEISGALYKLADPDAMQVNGIAAKELTKEENGEKVNMNKLVSAVMGDGLKLSLGTGAGVFADIADFTGDYSCTIQIAQISYGGISVPDVPATMSTKTTVSPVYLTATSSAVDKVTGTGSASAAITDFYGYIIDLAFRTNVANSNLQLQTKAVDRVYSDGQNAETMGGGASMSFTATTTAFDAYVSNLMKNIRVVFFDSAASDAATSGKKIIGYARLDADSVTSDANGKVTMNLVMTDANGNKKVKAGVTDADGKPVLDPTIMALTQNSIHQLSVLVYLDGTTITNADVSNAVKSMIGSMNLQFSSSATLTPMDYSDLKNGTNAETAAKTFRLNNVNSTALGVGVQYAAFDGTSVGIVLDGTVSGTVQATVGNSTYDLTSGNVTVGEKTVTGYTFTPTETIEATTRITLTLKGAQTPAVTSYTVAATPAEGVVDLVASATANTAYSFTLAEGYTLTEVKVGDNALTSADYTVSDSTYTIAAEKVTGNITITLTAPAAGG